MFVERMKSTRADPTVTHMRLSRAGSTSFALISALFSPMR